MPHSELVTQNFPKATTMPGLWQIAYCFPRIQNFHLRFQEVADLPSPNPTKSCSKGVSKTGNLLFALSLVCCKFGASLSWHSPQHVLHFYLHLWDLICCFLANEVCDLPCLCHVAAKGTSSDTSLHPPVHNTNNPVSFAGRQLSHGNLNLPQIPLPVPLFSSERALC